MVDYDRHAGDRPASSGGTRHVADAMAAAWSFNQEELSDGEEAGAGHPSGNLDVVVRATDGVAALSELDRAVVAARAARRDATAWQLATAGGSADATQPADGAVVVGTRAAVAAPHTSQTGLGVIGSMEAEVQRLELTGATAEGPGPAVAVAVAGGEVFHFAEAAMAAEHRAVPGPGPEGELDATDLGDV